MADTDMIDVTFTRQKVYHDGTSMIVAKKGDKFPLRRSLVAGFIAQGVIKTPSGWEDDLAEKNALRVADGGPQFAPTGEEDREGEEAEEPVSLSGKTKAELLAIAADEGVTVEEGATNAEITDAIEAARAAPVVADGGAPTS